MDHGEGRNEGLAYLSKLPLTNVEVKRLPSGGRGGYAKDANRRIAVAATVEAVSYTHLRAHETGAYL
eukprot:7310034-Pyramimonas_sp.AAC.1